MNRVLWVFQVLLGLYFVAIGILHFIVPDGLPAQLSWMYDLSEQLHLIAGTAEILGGLGLILPGITRVAPGLTVWAALGLLVVMGAAAVWHSRRTGEGLNIALNVVNGVLLAFVAYGRWRISPLRSE